MAWHQLNRICKWIDYLNTYIGQFVSWATLLLVAVTFTDVVMRYFFSTSYVFTQELEWHIFAFIFLMGAGYTLKQDGHVRVEVFYGRLSAKGKAWVNLIGVLFFLVPSCALFTLENGHRAQIDIQFSRRTPAKNRSIVFFL